MNWLEDQLFSGWTHFEIFYISILICIQFITYVISPDSTIGMISGLTGVLAVVMGMKEKKINFIFGFIQCVAMAYIAWKSHAYGSFLMDIVYIISQPIGWIMWGNDEAVNTFKKGTRNKIFFISFIYWIIGGVVLEKLGGQLPYFDYL